MYWYFSFLRPPPTHVSQNAGTLVITPQIANDLRTELYPEPIDVFASWSPCAPTCSAGGDTVTTRPTKLTTWRSVNAYKELRVSLPPNAREGQSWRLVLSAACAPDHHKVVLRGDTQSKAPFSVTSSPILFTARKSGPSEKQERIERLLTLPLSGIDPPSPTLRIVEQTSFDLDKVRHIRQKKPLRNKK
jgi:protein N-lysine methyltransferase METTL21D